MNDLPPEAAMLLEQARRDHNPSDHDAERVRRALHAKLGIAAALAPSALSSAITGKAAASTSVAAAGTGVQTGGVAAAGAVAASKAGTLWFGLKASKVFLAMITLSGVASVPLVMRSETSPRPHAQLCTSDPCPPGEADGIANGTLAPSVTPTPTAEALGDRRPIDRRARRQERRQRAVQNERARATRSDEHEAHVANDAPTPGDSAQVAHVATISSRATEASGATNPVSGGSGSASGTSVAVVNTAPLHASDATAATVSEVHEPSAPPELALIRGALTSLRDGAPQRALALLNEHGEVYPEGAFASERRGLRIVALCASGRLDEGRRERVVFLRREGSAPVAERVRHACQEAPGK